MIIHTADMDTPYPSYTADKIQMIVTQLTRILVILLILQTKSQNTNNCHTADTDTRYLLILQT